MNLFDKLVEKPLHSPIEKQVYALAYSHVFIDENVSVSDNVLQYIINMSHQKVGSRKRVNIKRWNKLKERLSRAFKNDLHGGTDEWFLQAFNVMAQQMMSNKHQNTLDSILATAQFVMATAVEHEVGSDVFKEKLSLALAEFILENFSETLDRERGLYYWALSKDINIDCEDSADNLEEIEALLILTLLFNLFFSAYAFMSIYF